MQIRALTETFFAKADRVRVFLFFSSRLQPLLSQLRDLWFSEIAKDPTATITGTRIDIVPWLSRVTLDIIGLTGMVAL